MSGSPPKRPTPEETRERLLAEITKIIDDPRDAYLAPEVRMPQMRSRLYAMMCSEFNRHAAFTGDVLVGLATILGMEGKGADVMLDEVRRLRRKSRHHD